MKRREDTLVDLTGLKERLESLADKEHKEVYENPFKTEQDDRDGSSSQALLSQARSEIELQDQHLDSLSQIITRQKQLGILIGDELDYQSGLLDDLDDGLEKTSGKLKKSSASLDKISKDAKSKKGSIIVIVLVIIIVLIIIIISVKKAL